MKLAAGEYYIGDPCYILDEDQYDVLLTETQFFMQGSVDRGGVMFDKVTGKYFSVFSTKYGDGCYRGNNGFTYGVDAGCISCIPVEMVSEPRYDTDVTAVQFDRDFEVRYDDGLIVFGDVVINTDPDEYYDEVEEEEDY
jgi:hypothetical protein